MKIMITLLLISSFGFSQSKDKKIDDKSKSEKKYTQEELDELVIKESAMKVERVRGKNIATLSEELFRKEKKLKEQKIEIDKKIEQLKINEQAFAKRVVNFDEQQQKILGCADENKKKEMERLDHLVKVISGMKPANAAQILSVQEPKISVRLIEKIDPARVSKIFNLMDKEISARLQKQFLSMKK